MSYRLYPFENLTIGEIKNLSDEDVTHFAPQVGQDFLKNHPEMVVGLGERIIREKIAGLKQMTEDLDGGE